MMTLWDMLNVCQYNQEFDIYVNNIYDQNIPVESGTAEDLRGSTEAFDHLMDKIEHYEVAPDGVIVILTKNSDFERRAEELYSEDYVEKWDRFKPDTRPWRFSIEIDNKHQGGKL